MSRSYSLCMYISRKTTNLPHSESLRTPEDTDICMYPIGPHNCLHYRRDLPSTDLLWRSSGRTLWLPDWRWALSTEGQHHPVECGGYNPRSHECLDGWCYSERSWSSSRQLCSPRLDLNSAIWKNEYEKFWAIIQNSFVTHCTCKTAVSPG